MAYNSGMLDEHAPRAKASEKSEYEQETEEEVKLVKQVNQMFRKAATSRKKYDKDWANNYKMYRGDQWLERRPRYKHREVINMIFQTITGQSSVMLDTRPIVGFLPEEPTDLELSEILNEVFESDWEKGNWMDELAEIIYDGHIYSVGYGYLHYDADANNGMGGQVWCCSDPFSAYPSPDATDVNKKCAYFIIAEPKDVDDLKLEYAGHKYVQKIKPDLEDLSNTKLDTKTLHRKRYNTDRDIDPTSKSYGSEFDDEFKAKSLKITVFMKPNDTEQVEKDDETTGEKIYITRLKYPRGRKIVVINNCVFEDKVLDDDHMEYPYQRYINYRLPREFFGNSEIDHTKGPQMVFNKLVNFSLDYLTLMGNPIWMNPVKANVNSRKLTSEPGLVVEYAGDASPSRMEGLSLPPFVFQLIDRMEKWFNDSAMTQDVTRGINPTGVTANKAIENLLEQAQKNIKQKMRNLDSMLKSMGRQWLSNCFQYYTAPQVFRLTNKQGVNKYFKFHIEDRQTEEINPDGTPKTKKVAVVRNYSQGSDGQYIPDMDTKEYEIRGNFDVKVNTVSGLPFTKSQNEQQVYSLFDRQIIDAEEVLTRLEYPNKDAILQRLQQQQAALAASQGVSNGNGANAAASGGAV